MGLLGGSQPVTVRADEDRVQARGWAQVPATAGMMDQRRRFGEDMQQGGSDTTKLFASTGCTEDS